MDSTIFKYKHQHQQQQHQHFNNSSSNYKSNNNHNNNNNQNSIFILNTATNNILPNNPEVYYSDFNDNNNVVSSSTSMCLPSSSTSSSSASTSVWSSASSTMCSPAAHAIQKLFNCSSNSLKLNQGNNSGIDAKAFKSNSELLKKKSKFWKYLEAEANDKNYQQGIDEAGAKQKKMVPGKSLKYKSNYCSNSYESDNQNQPDLAELLEYSCSLCDNCRCMDCQIGYFDCENSDDSNSEYSFHLSAYEEDELTEDAARAAICSDIETSCQQAMELKTSNKIPNCSPATYESCCYPMDNNNQHHMHNLAMDSCTTPNCAIAYEINCTKDQCCQQCFCESARDDADEKEFNNQQISESVVLDH